MAARSHVREIERVRREIVRLRDENVALNEQVKALVRSERQLSLSRRQLDRELRRLEVLSRFGLNAASATDPDVVALLAADSLLEIFPLEYAVAFRERRGTGLRPVQIRWVPGAIPPDADAAFESWNAARIERSRVPHAPLVGTETDLRARAPGLAPVLDWSRSALGAPSAAGANDEHYVLVIPATIGETAGESTLLLAWRTVAPMSLLEQLPTDDDLPFIRLVGAHTAAAIQNVVSYNAAQEAVRVRDEFVAIASHELKTPLTSMMLHVQNLRRNTPPGEPCATAIPALDRQCSRLAALVNQLLDVTQIGTTSPDLRLEPTDLVTLVREVVDSFAEEIARCGSIVRVESPLPVQVWCDRMQIEKVISNLVSNAIKFGSGKPIEITIQGNRAVSTLRVRDHGPGIAADAQRRLFERFERAVSSHHYGGLGLGLYLSRRIVEAHGGSIHIEHAPPDGAEFVVEIPTR